MSAAITCPAVDCPRVTACPFECDQPVKVPEIAKRSPMAARLWEHYADLPREAAPNLALMAGGHEDEAGVLTESGWKLACFLFGPACELGFLPTWLCCDLARAA